ncbi:MAG: transglycosylase domain-containing protein, partial [Myxococcaceae bacterium]
MKRLDLASLKRCRDRTALILASLGSVDGRAARRVLLTALGIWIAVLSALSVKPAWIEQLRFSQSQQILDRKGVLLREAVNENGERARWLALEEINPLVVEATLAVEDQRFYEHTGVDWQGVARAVLNNLKRRRVVSGASTITMQLARRVQPHPRTFRGKVTETVNALRIERAMSKREILEQYLNRVSYGAGTVGIEAASQRYFGKPSSHLSLAEAALLAGLPKAPSDYNPFRNLDAARARQRVVLGRMAVTARAALDELERAGREPVRLSTAAAPSALHFTEWVRGLAPGQGRITTTLDAELQQETEALVREHVHALQALGVSDAAVVILDNRSCEVLT